MSRIRPHAGIVLVLLFMVGTLFGPLAVLLSRSLGSEVFPLIGTALTRESFQKSLFQSLYCALIAGGLALMLGSVGAGFRTFTRLPGTLVDLLSFLPLVLPPFAGAVGVKRFLMEYGSINLWLLDNGYVTEPLPILDRFGLVGVGVLQALHLYPLVYFQLCAALGGQDPALTEAARVHGLPSWRVLASIRLPLLAPSLLSAFLFVSIFSVTDLGTPLLFDVPDTLAVKIYGMAREGVTDPMGYIYSLVLLALVAGISLILRLMTGKRDLSLSTDRPQAKAGGLWLIPAWLWVGMVAGVALFPHFAVILTASAQDWVASVWPEKLDISAFIAVFKREETRRALLWGLGLSSVSALMIVVAGLTAALYQFNEGRHGWVRRLSLVLDLPLVIPGILVAYGWLAAYSGTAIDAFQTPVLALLCAYTVRRIPLAFRSIEAGLASFSTASIEAGEVHGLGKTAVFRYILAPALSPFLLSSFLVGFAFTFFEVSDSLLLAVGDRVMPMAKALYTLANYPQDGLRLSSALGVAGMMLMTVVFLLAARFGGGLGAVAGGGQRK